MKTQRRKRKNIIKYLPYVLIQKGGKQLIFIVIFRRVGPNDRAWNDVQSLLKNNVLKYAIVYSHLFKYRL